MTDEDKKVSGNIYAKPDKYEKEGESYVIRNPVTYQGWGIPTSDITPDDLRALADRIESKRNAKAKDVEKEFNCVRGWLSLRNTESIYVSFDQYIDWEKFKEESMSGMDFDLMYCWAAKLRKFASQLDEKAYRIEKEKDGD